MQIQGYVDPNFPNPMQDGDARIVIYGYVPSLALAIVSLILFGAGLGLHAFQLYKGGKKYLWFSIPFVIGTVMELVGYIARALSNQISPYRVSFFVIQYFFIVVAPVLFSAGLYATISALIRLVDNSQSGGIRSSSPFGIPPKAILWTFISADVVCTIIQIVGAALIGTTISNGKDSTTANNILLAGLAIQVFFYLGFLILLGTFVSRNKAILFSKQPPTVSTAQKSNTSNSTHVRGLGAFMWLYVVSAVAVYLRTVFRLAETGQGLFSYASSHESLFGCFEFAPIILAVWVMGVWHPQRYV